MENYTTKKINPSTIEVKVTISKDAMSKSYETVLKNELKNVKAKGFRAGKTPRAMVEAELKPQIMFDVFNRLAQTNLQNIVSKENIELIASPEYKDIPEFSLEKDMTFTVHCTIMPEFKLGNLKKVKVELKGEKVKKEEIDKIMSQLEENKNIKQKKGTNEWAVQAAQIFSFTEVKTVDDLRNAIEKALQTEKDSIIQRQAETEALNQAIKLSNIEVPDPAVHYEAHEREHSFNHQLEGMGMRIDQYAAQMQTTVQSIIDTFHKDAKEALETDAFLKLYAQVSKLTVSDSELEEEIDKVKKANAKESDMYESAEWKEYIRKVSLKQKAYKKFLEEVMPKSK